MPYLITFLIYSFAVVQQPCHYCGWVSKEPNTVTQFNLATEYGNLGLLAHDGEKKVGNSFTELKLGDKIYIHYPDGKLNIFIVKEILRYQALDPNNISSSFRSLDDDTLLTAPQLFYRVYDGDYHLTLQTCIESGGNLSWGRLFVIAYPPKHPLRSRTAR